MRLVLPIRAIQAAALFLSKDETRYILGGIHLQKYRGKLTMIATDGRRMIVIDVDHPECEIEGEVDITFDPALLLRNLECVLLREVTLTLEGSQRQGCLMVTTFGREVLGMPVLDGTYPNWSQCLPSNEVQPVSAMTLNLGFLDDARQVLKLLTGGDEVAQIWPYASQVKGSSDEIRPVVIRPTTGDYAHRCLVVLMTARSAIKDAHPLPDFLTSNHGASHVSTPSAE